MLQTDNETVQEHETNPRSPQQYPLTWALVRRYFDVLDLDLPPSPFSEVVKGGITDTGIGRTIGSLLPQWRPLQTDSEIVYNSEK